MWPLGSNAFVMYLTPFVWFQHFLQFIEIIVLVSLVSKPKFCPVITYKIAYFLQRLSCRWDQNECEDYNLQELLNQNA